MSVEQQDEQVTEEGTPQEGIERFLSNDDDQGGEQASEDDDMAAGYASARNTGHQDDTADKGPAKSQAAPPAEAPTAAQPEKIGGRWTAEELDARLAKLDGLERGVASVAGHIGDLRKRLSGQKPRAITRADLSRVTQEFGEEYADALIEDLNKIGFGGHAGPSQDEIEALISERAREQVEQFERKQNKREVLRAHKDADDYFVNVDSEGKPVAGKHSEAFRQWIGTLPQERQQEIAESWDADVMTTALSEFKQSLKPAQQTPTEPTAPQGNTPNARAQRVARAIPVRGTGAATPPAGDPFVDGYNQARGRR